MYSSFFHSFSSRAITFSAIFQHFPLSLILSFIFKKSKWKCFMCTTNYMYVKDKKAVYNLQTYLELDTILQHNMFVHIWVQSVTASVPWSPGGRPLVQDVGNLEWTKQAAARTLLMRCQSSADSSVNNIQPTLNWTNKRSAEILSSRGSRTHLTWDNLEPRITKTLSFCPALVTWWLECPCALCCRRRRQCRQHKR